MLSKANNEPETPLYINLMPMIDVILCLLIFFMAATKLYDWSEQELDVEVPEVAAARPLTAGPAGELVVKVERDGSIWLDGEQLSIEQVVERLRAARTRRPNQRVLVRGDGRAYYQRVAEVMSACEAAGIRRLAVAVRQLGPGTVTQ
jgi:biopolymer transport protein ExbD